MAEKALILQEDRSDVCKSKEKAKRGSPIAKLIRKHRFGKGAHWKSRRQKKQREIEDNHKRSENEEKLSDIQENGDDTEIIKDHEMREVENKRIEMKSEGHISSRSEDAKNTSNLWAIRSSSILSSTAQFQGPIVETLAPAYWDYRRKTPNIFTQISDDSSDSDYDEEITERFDSCNLPENLVLNLRRCHSQGTSPMNQLNIQSAKKDTHNATTLSNLSVATQTSESMIGNIGPNFLVDEDGKLMEVITSSSSQCHQVLTNTVYEHAISNFLTSVAPEVSKNSHFSDEDILNDYLGTSPIVKEIVWGASNECVLETKLHDHGSRNSPAAKMALCHVQEEHVKVKENKPGKTAGLLKKISRTRGHRSFLHKGEKSKIRASEAADEESQRNSETVEDLVSSLLSIPENIPSPILRKKSRNSRSVSEERVLEEKDAGDEIRLRGVNESGDHKKKNNNKISRLFRRIRNWMERKK